MFKFAIWDKFVAHLPINCAIKRQFLMQAVQIRGPSQYKDVVLPV